MQNLPTQDPQRSQWQFNEEPFSRLIETIVCRWRQGRDHDFAADLRQTVLIACWRALETYDASRNKSLFNYTYCCASRAARDVVRSYRRCHDHLVSFEEALEQAEPDGNCSTYNLETVEAEEVFDPTLEVLIEDEDLYWACKQLRPQDKMILTWFYGWEQTDAQIAARLEMQPEAVKKRRQRSVRYLREWLAETRGRDDRQRISKEQIQMSPARLNLPTIGVGC